jgi:hypothetical protein
MIFKPAFIAPLGALALAAFLAAPALAGQNTPGTSNNAPNPLAPDQTFVGDYAGPSQAGNCFETRNVYDKHGRLMGRATVNICG